MSQTTVQNVTELPIDEVRPGDNYRKRINQSGIEDLAESIKANGLLQPILVRPEEGGYRIIAGERRYRAHVLAGLTTIKAVVRDDVDDSSESVAMLVENVAREDPNPMDEARGYLDHMERFGITAEELATKSGIKLKRINHRLSLLKLREEIQFVVTTGSMTVGMAYEMVNLEPEYQMAAFMALQKNPDMGWWTLNALCKDLAAEQQKSETMFDPDSFLQVEEFVARAKKRNRSIKGLSAMLMEMVDAIEELPGHDRFADLIAGARAMASQP